jgi:hypothetical protein
MCDWSVLTFSLDHHSISNFEYRQNIHMNAIDAVVFRCLVKRIVCAVHTILVLPGTRRSWYLEVHLGIVFRCLVERIVCIVTGTQGGPPFDALCTMQTISSFPCFITFLLALDASNRIFLSRVSLFLPALCVFSLRVTFPNELSSSTLMHIHARRILLASHYA